LSVLGREIPAHNPAKGADRDKMVEQTDETRRQGQPKLGKVLVSEGYITEKELETALSEQRDRLGEVLVKSDRVTAEQLHTALDFQKTESIKIGEVLKEMGYITPQDLDWALARMKRRLGTILIGIGLLNDSELQRALTLQTEAAKGT
jgi:hypothetical protein